ncbi:hypothetical protein PMKS-003847 [Pichia membranifaciens]|uniref:HMG box domain-containing protein n=2 Tax=Pichia membranifaciens TaxID=4926 RepID=A0A1Q2YLA8_9ASCO|nr:hypothetical protein PMKS-003847 [Pichia membranifaciens]
MVRGTYTHAYIAVVDCAQQHAGEAASLVTAASFTAAAANTAAGTAAKAELKPKRAPAKRQRATKQQQQQQQQALTEPVAEAEPGQQPELETEMLSDPIVELDEPAADTPASTAEDTPVAEEKKTRKKRAAKDPNAPKKPLTSYILFYNHLRSSVAEKNTELSQVDIAKEIARQWKEMSESDKNYWKGIYEKDKVKYDQEMVKYNATKDSPKAEKRSIIDIVDDDGPGNNPGTEVLSALPPDVSNEIAEPPKKKKSKKSKKSKKVDAA